VKGEEKQQSTLEHERGEHEETSNRMNKRKNESTAKPSDQKSPQTVEPSTRRKNIGTEDLQTQAVMEREREEARGSQRGGAKL